MTGHLGYLNALLGYPVHLQVGPMAAHGAQEDGVVNGRQEHQEADGAVQEGIGEMAVLDHGEQR